MADDNRDKRYRLPTIKLNKRIITRRMRKVENATVRHAHKFIFRRWNRVIEVQRHIIIWILTVGLLIAAAGLQFMWYQQNYRTTAPATDGTYAEAVLGPVDTLNPLFAASSAEQSAAYLMFSSILRYDTTGHLNYDLAKEVTADASHKNYRIVIRPDARWHDGTKVTAKDIAYTVSILKNPKVRTSYSGWEDISYKVVNDTTITFSLQSTYAAFEHALTFPIIPYHTLKDVIPTALRENTFSQNPIGSGPFMLRLVQNVDTKSGRKVIYLVRNDSYYNGRPHLARFQLHAYESNDAIINALAQNEVNAAADILPTDIDRVDLNRYNVLSKPIQSGIYAIFNMRSTMLKDISLRSALRLATDTKSIRDKLPSSPLVLDLPFTNNQLTGTLPKVPAYNQAQAKKTLDSIGWRLNASGVRVKGNKELRLSVVAMKDSEYERAMETLAGQWRSLGITVDTRVVDPNGASANVAQTVLQPRNYDVLIYRLNIGADPDVYAYWHSSQANAQGSNLANYSNVISDDALASARSRTEPALRNAKYITFARQWLNDVPAIGLYQSTMQYVYNKKIDTFGGKISLVSSIDRYSDVIDWSVGNRAVYKTP